MYLATEDALSEMVGLRLAREAGISIDVKLRKGGNGYLRSGIQKFIQMAALAPTILITDLDETQCPSVLIKNWFGNQAIPRDLIFRVVIREIESWILADQAGFAGFLGISGHHVPDRPESLPDAKLALLAIARRAPRHLRGELVAEQGSIASQGIGYNRLLIEFVTHGWSSERAAEHAPSLARARLRLAELAERLN